MHHREKNQEVVPEVYKAFMLAIVDVASHGKDTNTPATSLRQLQRVFYHDDRRRHDGKDKKDLDRNSGGGVTSQHAKLEDWLGNESVCVQIFLPTAGHMSNV